MNAATERSRADVYTQAYEALRKASAEITPVLAAAETGLVIVLDIAGMGKVNARNGTPTGDQLLQAVEASLRNELDGMGHVTRLAGDQFIVVIPGTVSVELAAASALDAVLQARVRGRWRRWVSVQAHIGTALWHDKVSQRAAIIAAGEALSQLPTGFQPVLCRRSRRATGHLDT